MLNIESKNRMHKAAAAEIEAYKEIHSKLNVESLKEVVKNSDNVDELAAIYELMPEQMVIDRIKEVKKDTKLSWVSDDLHSISPAIQKVAQLILDDVVKKLLPEHQGDQELVAHFIDDISESVIGDTTFNSLDKNEDVTEYMQSYLAYVTRKKIGKVGQ